jgi:hypothetical protein
MDFALAEEPTCPLSTRSSSTSPPWASTSRSACTRHQVDEQRHRHNEGHDPSGDRGPDEPAEREAHAGHTGCVEPEGHGTRHGRERIAPRQQRAHPDGHRQRSSAIMCR